VSFPFARTLILRLFSEPWPNPRAMPRLARSAPHTHFASHALRAWLRSKLPPESCYRRKAGHSLRSRSGLTRHVNGKKCVQRPPLPPPAHPGASRKPYQWNSHPNRKKTAAAIQIRAAAILTGASCLRWQ
jgi:hypothetical protein